MHAVLNDQSWEADLSLQFARRDRRSFLAKRAHRGPLVVQKTLYPEGEAVCHAVILHPPGGVAGGDRLGLRVDMDSGAHALLTTPGAGKWYKSNGVEAVQEMVFRQGDDTVLEWLPQETIVYDAVEAVWDVRVELAPKARYAGWEILCLGRLAHGERFRTGSLRQRLRIFRDGHLLWGERARFQGGDRLLDSPAGLGGHAVTAIFVVAAGAVPPEVMEACRAVVPPTGATGGVTALPEIFAARCLGDNALAARRYFEDLWAVLRPWYAGAAAQSPRIWNT